MEPAPPVPPAHRPLDADAVAAAVARLDLGQWAWAAPRVGLRLALADQPASKAGDSPHEHGAPGAAPTLAWALGPGVGVEAVLDLGFATVAVPAGLEQRWSLSPADVLAQARANTRTAPARRLDRAVVGVGRQPEAQLTVVWGGPFTTGLAAEVAMVIPGADIGRGVLGVVGPQALAVALTTGPEPAPGLFCRLCDLITGLARAGGADPCCLVQFHRATEFAIFGIDETRRDDQWP